MVAMGEKIPIQIVNDKSISNCSNAMPSWSSTDFGCASIEGQNDLGILENDDLLRGLESRPVHISEDILGTTERNGFVDKALAPDGPGGRIDLDIERGAVWERLGLFADLLNLINRRLNQFLRPFHPADCLSP